MHFEIGSYEAKTNLSEILRRVEAGESFTITNRGRPIADLTPCKINRHEVIANAISNILAIKKQTVSSETFLEFKNSGRK